MDMERTGRSVPEEGLARGMTAGVGRALSREKWWKSPHWCRETGGAAFL